jgi:hypothetical protein
MIDTPSWGCAIPVKRKFVPKPIGPCLEPGYECIGKFFFCFGSRERNVSKKKVFIIC